MKTKSPIAVASEPQQPKRLAFFERYLTGWVINQSSAASGSRDPLLVACGQGEVQFVRKIVEKHSQRTALVPWVTEEPAGSERLQQLFQSS
jgi:arsenite/tail-anchored protein-transporting ATPase